MISSLETFPANITFKSRVNGTFVIEVTLQVIFALVMQSAAATSKTSRIGHVVLLS